ncbi:MAG: hypothetical protein K2K98_12400 [Muribaculaceae bacterium]|nr:hypothetical protein [Muribaculaceae bacterium]
MKKKIFLPILSGAILLLTGCVDDTSMFSEPESIRSYETDSQIMAQFVEIDMVSGAYVLNPDKKVTATDHIFNLSREELMKVSQINRDRFLNEMEAVNSQLSVMRRSGLTSAFIYSTLFTNMVIDGDDSDSFRMSKLPQESFTRGTAASLQLEYGKINSVDFHSGADMVMNINAHSRSSFYFAQVTLGDRVDADAEVIIISGVKSLFPDRSYRFTVPAVLDSHKKISGITLLGNGNLTVSISQ